MSELTIWKNVEARPLFHPVNKGINTVDFNPQKRMVETGAHAVVVRERLHVYHYTVIICVSQFIKLYGG
jgi:hypothetical protein